MRDVLNHALANSLDDKIKHGGIYIGAVDWYVPRFDDRQGEGSIVIKMGSRGRDTYFKTFKFTSTDIEYPRGFVENLPNFNAGDVVMFKVYIDVHGNFARNIKFYGSDKSEYVKRKLVEQEEDFNHDDWYQTFQNVCAPPTPKVRLKLRSRPRGEK